MKHPTWLAFLLVTSLILPLAPAPVTAQSPAVDAAPTEAQNAAVNAPSAPDTGEGQYEVHWTVTASASGSGADEFKSWTVFRNIFIEGSAIVDKPPNDFATVEPYQLTVTDTSQAIVNTSCYQQVIREYITDPGRYSGHPDIFWSNWGGKFPRQREDGSWYMPDPFFREFWISGLAVRDFTYHWSRDHKDFCHPNLNYYSEEDRERTNYIGWYDFEHGFEIPFEGDPEGVVFGKSFTWTSNTYIHSFTVPMQIDFRATIRRIGGCADRDGSIDANDPVVKDIRLRLQVENQRIPPNDGDTLSPPDPATVTVRATCEGAPVRNVTLKVAVDALPNSGGHRHTNGANPRPRGYLRGPQQPNYVEITAKVPSINVTTNDQGEAAIRFLPGRDYNSGATQGNCAGKQRGIAGDYKIDIATTQSKFGGKKLDTTIQVERMDFVPLVSGDHYYEKYNSSVHPEGTWGKLPTILVIQPLAQDFYDAQVAHNAELVQAGKTEWPIVQLAIIDISLPDGGLFDTGGTNVCATGQPQVSFIPWQIPHQTHLKGKGIDISTGVWWNSGNATKFKWWRNTLRALGCQYGTWAKEAAFHLEADQSSSGWGSFHTGCTYTPDTAAAALDQESTSPAFVTVPYAGADVFVSLLPNTQGDEIVLAAPGEVVSYTVGVNNLLGDAPANGVEVKVTLPAGLTFVSGDPVPARFDAPSQPVWVVGDLAAGAFPQLFDFNVQVDAGVAPDTALILEAVATTTSPETIVDNNREGDDVIVRAPGPDLVALSDLEGVALTADAPVTVTFDIGNAGSALAAGASMNMTLPPGVTVRSSAPLPPAQAEQTLTWTLGDLAVDTTQPLTVVLDLAGAVTGSFDPVLGTSAPVTFTWLAMTAGDIDLDNNGGTVVNPLTLAGHDALVLLGVTGAPVGGLIVGQTVTYTLDYENLGNRSALSATLSLRLGTGLTPLDAQPPAGPPVDGELPWALGDLAVGAEGTVTVRAKVESVPANGSLTVATIAAAGYDIAPVNNIAYDAREAALVASTGGQRFFLPLLDR